MIDIMDEFFYTEGWINYKNQLIKSYANRYFVQLDDYLRRIIFELIMDKTNIPVEYISIWNFNYSNGNYVFSANIDRQLLNYVSGQLIDNDCFVIDYEQMDNVMVSQKIIVDRRQKVARIEGEVRVIDDLIIYDMSHVNEIESFYEIYSKFKNIDIVDWEREKMNFIYNEMAKVRRN